MQSNNEPFLFSKSCVISFLSWTFTDNFNPLNIFIVPFSHSNYFHRQTITFLLTRKRTYNDKLSSLSRFVFKEPKTQFKRRPSQIVLFSTINTIYYTMLFFAQLHIYDKISIRRLFTKKKKNSFDKEEVSQ